MEKLYHLTEGKLPVSFQEGLIRIRGPEILQRHLSMAIVARTKALVMAIKQDYRIFYGKQLQVSDNSMLIEIWGHAYAGVLAKIAKRSFRFGALQKLAQEIASRSDVIDCGERDIDQNRIFWDMAAIVNPAVIFFLPRKLKRSKP